MQSLEPIDDYFYRFLNLPREWSLPTTLSIDIGIDSFPTLQDFSDDLSRLLVIAGCAAGTATTAIAPNASLPAELLDALSTHAAGLPGT